MITSLDNVANSLASRSSGVEWSGIRDIFAMAKHIDGVVSLASGNPTLIHQSISETLQKQLWMMGIRDIIQRQGLRIFGRRAHSDHCERE